MGCAIGIVQVNANIGTQRQFRRRNREPAIRAIMGGVDFAASNESANKITIFLLKRQVNRRRGTVLVTFDFADIKCGAKPAFRLADEHQSIAVFRA